MLFPKLLSSLNKCETAYSIQMFAGSGLCFATCNSHLSTMLYITTYIYMSGCVCRYVYLCIFFHETTYLFFSFCSDNFFALFSAASLCC